MARRDRRTDHEDVIGSRAKVAPDNGPLFGDAPAEKLKPGPAGKRFSDLPPSYDTLIGRHAERSRMPEDVALRGKTARGSESSEAAARAVDDMVPTLAWLVLQHIISCGERGATREEVAIALGRRMSSVTARIRELYLMGHIGSNGETRTNPETSLENEVMLYETHVRRWQDGQARPPVPLKHGRRTTTPAD